jgi:hypothetical protein
LADVPFDLVGRDSWNSRLVVHRLPFSIPLTYTVSMPRRASKEDEVQAAARVIRTVIDRAEKRAVDPAVSAAAAALSKLGASKGGEARAKSLTAKERSEIAKKGAAARWKR